mmetsp:Transcript_10757/g.17843  ORF Transcript_10757/g.17843 Transcript_10757/m.17843 type:complete len:367 (+) Transcript_10757:155-1255(+)
MIKFSLYSAAGVALLSSSSTDAFVPSKRSTSATFERSSSLDRDWDNDDFLASLSGGSDEIAEANAKYQAQSQSRAKINEWRARQMQMQMESSTPVNDSSERSGDYGPSPELLRKMMGESDDESIDQVRQQPLMSPPEPSGQFQQPPQMQQQQPPPVAAPPPPQQQPEMQQQQFYDANGNPVSMPMVYDANGNLVPYYPPPPPPQQQPMQQQQPARAQPINAGPSMEPVAWEPPLPNNPKTSGGDPRPVGYNADSYAVSNTADVYFAQLKQDSRVRKRAWLSGDKETANQVFTDPSVSVIKDQWVDNPYTKEKNIQEARAEIEGAVRMQLGGNEDESTRYSSGVSYKQKLAEMKARRRGGGGMNNNF